MRSRGEGGGADERLFQRRLRGEAETLKKDHRLSRRVEEGRKEGGKDLSEEEERSELRRRPPGMGLIRQTPSQQTGLKI